MLSTLLSHEPQSLPSKATTAAPESSAAQPQQQQPQQQQQQVERTLRHLAACQAREQSDQL